ncbi:MAG: HDOD domain-containing protein, partial [Desulfuromonadales bacterium]|nr:HDOD domain-containing protein [Desulfuromonadales bacterium]NIS41494.1 HDOD domain-containing protein [Desulfuromonadales bacterium]
MSSLGMATILPQTASREKDEAAAAGFGTLWEASLRCAHAARDIARLTGYDRPDEAYLAGLLHSIGRTLLLHRYPEKYSELLADDFCAPMLAEVEKDHFGTTGAELAANLTADWHQAPFFSDALLYQDETAEAVADAPPLVKLVNLAHKLSTPHEDSDWRAAAALLFDLEPAAADSVREAASTRAAEAAAAFNVAGGDRAPRGDEATDALSRHVKTAAAMHGLVQEINLAHQSPWAVMLRHLALLLGLPRALAFEHRPESGTLGFVHASFDQPKLDGFDLPLGSGRSLLSRSVLRDQPLFLEQENATPPA